MTFPCYVVSVDDGFLRAQEMQHAVAANEVLITAGPQTALSPPSIGEQFPGKVIKFIVTQCQGSVLRYLNYARAFGGSRLRLRRETRVIFVRFFLRPLNTRSGGDRVSLSLVGGGERQDQGLGRPAALARCLQLRLRKRRSSPPPIGRVLSRAGRPDPTSLLCSFWTTQILTDCSAVMVLRAHHRCV
jgi:hypothetical protein